jgi:hypothetical protein
MSTESRRNAEERLAAAMADAGMADSRAEYRERLRRLKKERPAAFRQATEHYERVVLPALLEGSDPAGAWLAFGLELAGLAGPGRAVAVDGTGRSCEWRAGGAPGALVLFLPEDRQAAAVVLAAPATPTAAQAATIDLLVAKKLSL